MIVLGQDYSDHFKQLIKINSRLDLVIYGKWDLRNPGKGQNVENQNIEFRPQKAVDNNNCDHNFP